MMARAKTTKQNAVAKKKARVNNGILDNEVNKSDSRSTPQKRKANDTERKSAEPKTNSKKAKEKAVEETEVNFTEDDEEVTFHVNDSQQPGCSRDNLRVRTQAVIQPTPEEKVQNQIREAEVSKAKILGSAGENFNPDNLIKHSALVDEDFLLVALHVDTNTLQKIVNCEYVDFAKLIQKDRILQVEEQKLEMVIKGGKTYWSPVAESTSINSFGKWE